jgi:hypothetical protein
LSKTRQKQSGWFPCCQCFSAELISSQLWKLWQTDCVILQQLQLSSCHRLTEASGTCSCLRDKQQPMRSNLYNTLNPPALWFGQWIAGERAVKEAAQAPSILIVVSTVLLQKSSRAERRVAPWWIQLQGPPKHLGGKCEVMGTL